MLFCLLLKQYCVIVDLKLLCNVFLFSKHTSMTLFSNLILCVPIFSIISKIRVHNFLLYYFQKNCQHEKKCDHKRNTRSGRDISGFFTCFSDAEKLDIFLIIISFIQIIDFHNLDLKIFFCSGSKKLYQNLFVFFGSRFKQNTLLDTWKIFNKKSS